MSLQGFNGRRLQGVYGVLQGFGNRVFRESDLGRLFVYDDKVYVVDEAISSVKIYDLDGLKLGEFAVEPRQNPIIPSYTERLRNYNRIFVDSTRIIVGCGTFAVIYDHDGVEVDSIYVAAAYPVFYNEEFYQLYGGYGGSFFRVYDMDGNITRSFGVGDFQDSGWDVKAGKIYYVGNRRREYGEPTVFMRVYDTDGDLSSEFEYYEVPGFPDPPDKIGLSQSWFVAHGDHCHSGTQNVKTVYRNSTTTGAELNVFTLDTGSSYPRYVDWYNNELYYSTNTSSIMVFNDTTGEFIREWSTID